MYEVSFVKLSDRYFKACPWPNVEAIKGLVDDDHVFCLLYKVNGAAYCLYVHLYIVVEMYVCRNVPVQGEERCCYVMRHISNRGGYLLQCRLLPPAQGE